MPWKQPKTFIAQKVKVQWITVHEPDVSTLWLQEPQQSGEVG